jgi:hypothetical protein
MNYLLLGVLMIGGPAVYATAGVFFGRKILHGGSRKGEIDLAERDQSLIESR